MIRRMGRPGLLGLAARTAVVAGTANAVSGGMRRSQENRSMQQQQAEAYEAQEQQIAMQAAAAQAVAQQQPVAPAAPALDLVAEIQKLAALKDAGILDGAEFAAAKAKLLS
ncbi:hemolysin activation/secretion protein [Microbacterium halimionae]|uniref:Hemolysin activation/secretion protein n=1 Tax=Microbacterium halimionae TaxID=1526413 RepID=A0A7W3PMI2_9MICO|nr:SHOCT domain-containing protein [Microbacterium halimionae]MBA8816959.1 hemolysin activation/secretion protein [Microbacterium halimionae]NII94502.1 hemolysin activation/secretion protein [Microbacterium halimionae]